MEGGGGTLPKIPGRPDTKRTFPAADLLMDSMFVPAGGEWKLVCVVAEHEGTRGFTAYNFSGASHVVLETDLSKRVGYACPECTQRILNG